MSSASVSLNGVLTPEGTLVLEDRPDLPPGPVEVLLRSRPAASDEGGTDLSDGAAADLRANFRQPDAPMPDTAISAPYDLPRPGPIQAVKVRHVSHRDPEPPTVRSDAGE